MPERPRILIPTPTSIDLEYNRQCWPQYALAVKEAGGEAIEVDLALGEGRVRALARVCDGILLPGSLADVSPERYGQERESVCGPPDRVREACDWTLLDEVFATGVPLLAICYGMQSLNVFCGGTLLQDIDVVGVRHTAGPSVGVAHTAVVAGDSFLAGLIEGTEAGRDRKAGARLPINSSHHQAVGIVGDGLRVVGRSAGDDVVEAIEPVKLGGPFLLGVQWHPERTTGISGMSHQIFRAFVLSGTASRAGCTEQ